NIASEKKRFRKLKDPNNRIQILGRWLRLEQFPPDNSVQRSADSFRQRFFIQHAPFPGDAEPRRVEFHHAFLRVTLISNPSAPSSGLSRRIRTPLPSSSGPIRKIRSRNALKNPFSHSEGHE